VQNAHNKFVGCAEICQEHLPQQTNMRLTACAALRPPEFVSNLMGITGEYQMNFASKVLTQNKVIECRKSITVFNWKKKDEVYFSKCI